jgi:hypothetical protein
VTCTSLLGNVSTKEVAAPATTTVLLLAQRNTNYTCTVVAVNAAGTGVKSVASNIVARWVCCFRPPHASRSGSCRSTQLPHRRTTPLVGTPSLGVYDSGTAAVTLTWTVTSSDTGCPVTAQWILCTVKSGYPNGPTVQNSAPVGSTSYTWKPASPTFGATFYTCVVTLTYATGTSTSAASNSF